MSNNKVETLFKTKWLALKKLTMPDHGAEYIFSHSPLTGGQAVAVLPYRDTTDGKREYLLRREIVPPWDDVGYTVCSITGAHDQETPHETACKELWEEGGYSPSPENVKPLGACRTSKASDTTYHLFTVNLTGAGKGKPEPVGDGTGLEAAADTFWGTAEEMLGSPDAILQTMAIKLSFKQNTEAGMSESSVDHVIIENAECAESFLADIRQSIEFYRDEAEDMVMQAEELVSAADRLEEMLEDIADQLE